MIKTMQTTKHTHDVVFGRKEEGCPRCEELLAGAAPIKQAWRVKAAPVAAFKGCRGTAACAVCCTCGDW